jgi:hypothetical protein
MKRLLLNGDPGIRQGAIIEFDGEKLTCFSVTRNGDYHGPGRVQLSCVVGSLGEYDAFQKRQFIPHQLEVDVADGDAVRIIEKQSDIAARN